MVLRNFRGAIGTIGVTLIGLAGYGHSAELVIYPDTVVEVNGQSKIPDGLFGITTYNGAEAACSVKQREALKHSGIRWAGMPAHANWLLPEEAPPGFAAGWADTAAAGALLDRLGKGYPIPKCVQGWRDMEIEPMLYLLGMQGIFKWPASEADATVSERPENMPPPLSPHAPRY